MRDFVELVFAIRVLDGNQQLVEPRQDFDRVDRKGLLVNLRIRFAGAMHLAKARGVPKFRREVPAFLDLLFVERNVLADRRDPHQAEAQSIRTVFRDQIERVRRVA